ncbi:MAG: PfkB family carbohydrate kinase, partial [Rhodosalinus sp.]
MAADMHAIGDLEDAYNQDWMAAAHILFQSHENLPVPAAEWLAQIGRRYAPALAVVGRGVDGALLRIHADGSLHHIPAVQTRPVVNSIGAGDALFSAFVHSYARSGDPVAALRRAVVFASYKIGVAGAADGFL